MDNYKDIYPVTNPNDDSDYYRFQLSGSKFIICDINSCAESERTFDIPLFDLANDEVLLSKLHLYYIDGNYGAPYTFESRAKWFCGYFDSLFKGDASQDLYKIFITNPILRLLITDTTLFKEIKTIFKNNN